MCEPDAAVPAACAITFAGPLTFMAEDPQTASPEHVSRLLADWANRDPSAREQLVPIVYNELRRIAHHYMRGERAGHTLQTTALVNEVYLRLAGIDGLRWRDRAHFFA